MSEKADPRNEANQSAQYIKPAISDKAQSSDAPGNSRVPDYYEKKTKEFAAKTAVFIRDSFSLILSRIRRVVSIIDEHNGIVTAAATAAIALLTWSLATDSGGQFKVMSDQLKEMRESSGQVERAIAAANRQAAAMEDANRAWIAVGTIEIVGPWQQGKDTTVKVTFVNSGREVATSVRNHVRLIPIPVGKDFVFGETSVSAGDNPMCNGDFNEGGGMLAFPDSRRDSWSVEKIKGSDLSADIFSGNSVLILQGCLSYLSSNVLKVTSYCFLVGSETKHATAQNSPWCQDGNYAN